MSHIERRWGDGTRVNLKEKNRLTRLFEKWDSRQSPVCSGPGGHEWDYVNVPNIAFDAICFHCGKPMWGLD